jgi:hypothetical protein
MCQLLPDLNEKSHYSLISHHEVLYHRIRQSLLFESPEPSLPVCGECAFKFDLKRQLYGGDCSYHFTYRPSKH